MEDIDVMNKLRKIPVFSITDFRKIVRTTYAKQALMRLIKKKHVFRIIRNRFSVYNDPFVIAPWLCRSSYLGSYSALRYHNLMTQLPQNIVCITGSAPKKINILGTEVVYRHSKYIFGYEMKDYSDTKIPVSLPEKALIDSIGFTSLDMVLEEIGEFNKDILWDLAQKMPNHIKRRIAYIIYKVWKQENKVNSGRTIYLDPLGSKKGKINQKYNIIENVIL
ncbi:MAG: hypothetical protein WC356_00515 [Candidatus Micrarchaeia archaeon]|jgi:predicted transcriptional regulator of viral defense system